MTVLFPQCWNVNGKVWNVSTVLLLESSGPPPFQDTEVPQLEEKNPHIYRGSPTASAGPKAAPVIKHINIPAGQHMNIHTARITSRQIRSHFCSQMSSDQVRFCC